MMMKCIILLLVSCVLCKAFLTPPIIRNGHDSRHIITQASQRWTVKLSTPSAAAAAAVVQPASTAMQSSSSSTDHMIYQGFWDIALKKMEARLSGLRPLPIPSDLKQQEIVMEGKGKRPDTKTMFTTHAYALPGKIRQARAALLYTENTPPKVLNFVIFPERHLDLPIFGADLVSLPGGHLIVLDFQPTLHPSHHPHITQYYHKLRHVYDEYSQVLPNGGDIPEASKPFFSDCHLFTRIEDDEIVITTVLHAFEAYLDAYLDLLVAIDGNKKSQGEGEEEDGIIIKAQKSYSNYRAKNDPARGMLTRMFGEAWTEKLIYDLLFDLADKPSS